MKRIHACALILILGLCAGTYPGWWSKRGVLDSSRTPADYQAVSQGQVKWMAACAATEFAEKLPDAGLEPILALVDGFPAGNNARPANLGMLKATARPFYDCLIGLGWAESYPWAGKQADDFHLANQGQLKNLFSFDLDAIDLDEDGVPDWWLRKYGRKHFDENGEPIEPLAAYQTWLASQSNVPAGENTLVGDGSTNPAGLPADVVVLDGSDATGFLGSWTQVGKSIRSISRRGHVEYTLEVPQGDIYRVRVSFKAISPGSSDAHSYDLNLSIGGQFIERQRHRMGDGGGGFSQIDTPFLSQGSHRLRIFWDNPMPGLSLQIDQVRLQKWSEADQNGNGIQDWVENRLIARNRVEIAPLESAVSPACVEGLGRYVATHTLAGAEAVQPGPNGTWYANLALPDDGSDLMAGFSLENGGRSLTRRMRWRETNLLLDPVARRVLRKGDALRLGATPFGAISGSATIQVDGQLIGTVEPGQAIPYAFQAAGNHVISASFTGTDGLGAPLSATRALAVQIVHVEPESLAAQIGYERMWARPATWPEGARIEWDSQVHVLEQNGQTRLRTEQSDPLYGVVRLDPAGPVLGAVALRGFRMWGANDTGLTAETTFPDGSFVALTHLILSPAVPGVRVEQHCRGPIAYLDGSRILHLPVSELDSLGSVQIRFMHSGILPHSVCHFTMVLQDDTVIGVGD